jgi:hypothetical protein
MRIVTRTVPAIVGAMVMMAGFAVATDDDGATAAPAFRVEQGTVDLGEVRAGDTAVAVFRFLNAGDTDVRILRAKPS